MSVRDFASIGEAESNRRLWTEAVPGMALTIDRFAVRKDGSTYPVEISLTCQLIEGEKLFLGFARNVTEREAARLAREQAVDELEAQVAARTAELSDVNERMILAARVGGLGIWDYDILKGEMVCDAQWHQIMGLDPSHPVTRIEQFRPSVHPEDVDRVTEVDSTAVRLAADRKDYEIEFRIQPADGNIKWIRSAAAIVQDDGGRPVRAVGFVVDITEARLAKHSLEKQSLQDPLTGLGNRRALDEAIQRECIRVERTGDAISVAMIDIDYFKLYNDRSGHLFGDDALRAVANIIAKRRDVRMIWLRALAVRSLFYCCLAWRIRERKLR